MFYEKYKNIITNVHYELAQEQMKKEFILRDMGIGFIMKDEIKKEIESGEVVEVKIDNSTIKGSIGAVTLNKTLATFATRKLLEYIKK